MQSLSPPLICCPSHMAKLVPIRDLLRSIVQKRCLETSASSSPVLIPSSSPPPPSSFTVGYLMKSCGFPLQTAISISHNLKLDEKHSQRYDSVVDFLRSHGFSDTQIAKLVARRPLILRCRMDTNIKPKIEFLVENGFVGSLLPELILNVPEIWRKSLSSQIRPSIDMLNRYLETNHNVVSAVMRSSWILTTSFKRTQRNIDFLISEKVPVATLSKMILRQPRILLHTLDRLAHVLKSVNEVGLQRDAPMFASVFRVMTSLSDSTLKRKLELFRSLGWSEEDIKSAFKRDPTCFSASEDKIKGGMDFYVNTLKLEPGVIIGYPKALTYSIAKRILPRYSLLKLLESEGKIQITSSKKTLWVLLQSEKNFLKNYVNKYLGQFPNLMEVYCGGCSSIMANR